MSQSRLRLDYLDGMRGLAALYVVIYHIASGGFGLGALPPAMSAVLKLATYGRFAVAVFIVLSGYCLMLPVARSQDARLRGGFVEYLRRRAWRILPPYYAALALSLILIALVPALSRPTGTMWDGTTPAFTPGALFTHLFVVHNLSQDWIFRINGPLWSVATEWQIYFFFPLLLLPVWRRLGIAAATFVAFAIGLAPGLIFGSRFDNAAPWYLGLFTLGMAGAAIGFSGEPHLQRWRNVLPWGATTAALWGVGIALGVLWAKWWWQHLPFADSMIGLATASLLVFCTRHLTFGVPARAPVVLRLMELRPAVHLGRFSYSLYLIHMPVLVLLFLLLRDAPISPAVRMITELVVGVPLAIVCAYLFHLGFERRFMVSPATPRRAVPAEAMRV